MPNANEFRAHPVPGLGEAPAYSKGLEFAVSMFLRGMDPESKLVLARRMLQVFSHLEQVALEELGR